MKTYKKFWHDNLANLMTGSRIVFTFLFCYSVNQLLNQEIGMLGYGKCALWLVLIWLSDYLDGKLARKWHIASKFGATFDVLSDIIFVFMIHIQLVYNNVVPAWFLLVIAEKIINYVGTSHWISRRTSGEFVFIRDPIGKVVSASYFVTPAWMLIGYELGPWWYCVAMIGMGTVSLFGLVSSAYRLRSAFSMSAAIR